jgi:hypothetical protein
MDEIEKNFFKEKDEEDINTYKQYHFSFEEVKRS